ncbi:MAG TPA: hypothetical protein VFQ53_24350 [Kofleriaceae bacterium]|nr:hypothetical protein [Kofleriaceae bacterium]
MKKPLVALAALLSIAGAQGARALATEQRTGEAIEEPYAPSPGAAPIVSLGYREVAADLLFFRLIGYFGGPEHTAEGVAALAEAIAALDPMYYRVYEWGARAMVASKRGRDNRTVERAVALLEAGMAKFPTDAKLPMLAGEICITDYKTKDPAERRIWDEKGARFLEAAVRKPNAPATASTLAATLRTKLGQRQRAIDGLKEMLLITDDDKAKQRILEKLAELENQDASEIAAEYHELRKRFEDAWRRERPVVTPSMYVLLGPPIRPGFDMADLATGGRDLVGSEPAPEKLEPLYEPAIPIR